MHWLPGNSLHLPEELDHFVGCFVASRCDVAASGRVGTSSGASNCPAKDSLLGHEELVIGEALTILHTAVAVGHTEEKVNPAGSPKSRVSELQAVEEGHGLDIAKIINRAISSDGVYDLSDNTNLIVFQVEHRANSDLNFVAGGCVAGETRDLHSRASLTSLQGVGKSRSDESHRGARIHHRSSCVLVGSGCNKCHGSPREGECWRSLRMAQWA